MSHIHIPDGVLPLWLVALGWLITVLVLFFCSLWLRRGDLRRQVPFLGVMAAVMLVGMATELVPIAYHINLTVLAGIVLGPVLGFVAAFLVDLFLGLFGHGGLTVIGLNTLVIGAEIALGYLFFRLLFRGIGRVVRAPGKIAALATVITLFLTTWLFIGIVALANIEPSQVAEPGAVDPATLSFKNPFGGGILAFGAGEQEHQAQNSALGFDTFVRLVLLLGFIGWIIEATVTGLIIGFVAKVKPDLIRVSAKT